MRDKKRVRVYRSLSDDFYRTGEPRRLPDGYRYERDGIGFRLESAFVYAAALVFSTVYCRVFLHVRFRGANKLRRQKGGFFLYGNHTQPVGDVFDPALACFPKRIYTVVSPDNLYLPGIGRILPPLGAIPLPDTLSGMKRFLSAVEKRVKTGHPVVIYPEAHVWDYYTGIRPFPDTAFKYPVRFDVPVYCLTATYEKRRFGKKPRITIYADGPFASDDAANLRDAVFACMQKRAAQSTVAYIEYVQKSENETVSAK